MKIVRRRGRGADRERLDAAGFQVHYVVLVLHYAGDQDKTFVENDHAVLVVEVGADDDACSAGFVFEGHEDDSFGGAGALARDDASGRGRFYAVRKMAQFDGGLYAARAENVAAVGHGMVAGGESGAVIVGD